MHLGQIQPSSESKEFSSFIKRDEKLLEVGFLLFSVVELESLV